MSSQWSFGRKISVGFALAVALTIVIGLVSIHAIKEAIRSKDQVIDVTARAVIEAKELDLAAEEDVAATRGYLLTGEHSFEQDLSAARARFDRHLQELTRDLPEARGQIEAIRRAEVELVRVADETMELRRRGAQADVVAAHVVNEMRPRRRAIRDTIEALVLAQERSMAQATAASASAANASINLVVGATLLTVVMCGAIAFLLGRTLGRQIGSAVGQVQNSSAELQTAANQQATGTREQATAMAEITTTISELLTTSRQIAESAQRVAQMAEQTAGSARAGEATMSRASESIGAIRRQVELIVEHMLDLGKKSQQIGSIADIVSELAEQTNILSINATIEASGAGEAGKRFSVVADEVRKLADRVTASTKEIRTLIEEVRSAVNTTVMATETGSKAVDGGTRQFGDVLSSFQQIAGLVANTTDAAREIELSTKQQATAVEQVNVAITNVAQATRETEASSTQTLQTASQLASLSRELLRVVRPEAAG